MVYESRASPAEDHCGPLAIQVKEYDDFCGFCPSDEDAAIAKVVEQMMSERDPGALLMTLAEAQEQSAEFMESQDTVFPMQRFRAHETRRLVAVLQTFAQDSKRMQAALNGLAHFSSDLESLCQAALRGRVPHEWQEKMCGIPTNLPLMAWVKDLRSRVAWLSNWHRRADEPSSFAIPLFYSARSFFAAALQQSLIAHNAQNEDEPVAFEDVCFQAEVLSGLDMEADVVEPPDEGVLVVGMILYCAHWDIRRDTLTSPYKFDRANDYVYQKMPIINFIPSIRDEDSELHRTSTMRVPIYAAPVVRTSGIPSSAHAAQLLRVSLPCDGDVGTWLLRGVALFCRVE